MINYFKTPFLTNKHKVNERMNIARGIQCISVNCHPPPRDPPILKGGEKNKRGSVVELTHKETSGNTKPYRKRTDDGAIFFNYHRDELRNTHLNLIE